MEGDDEEAFGGRQRSSELGYRQRRRFVGSVMQKMPWAVEELVQFLDFDINEEPNLHKTELKT